jgi:hypothetical protein
LHKCRTFLQLYASFSTKSPKKTQVQILIVILFKKLDGLKIYILDISKVKPFVAVFKTLQLLGKL